MTLAEIIIRKISTEKQKCRIIRSATRGQLFQTLCSKSQRRIPVVVYVLPLSLDYDTLYFWLPAASEFCCTKRMISTICHRLYNRYLLTPCRTLFIFVDLLTYGVRARTGGLQVRFSADVRGLPTSYWLMLSKSNPRSSYASKSATALARSLRAFDAWSFEQHEPNYLSHWLACIFDGMVLKMYYNWRLHLVIF